MTTQSPPQLVRSPLALPTRGLLLLCVFLAVPAFCQPSDDEITNALTRGRWSCQLSRGKREYWRFTSAGRVEYQTPTFTYSADYHVKNGRVVMEIREGFREPGHRPVNMAGQRRIWVVDRITAGHIYYFHRDQDNEHEAIPPSRKPSHMELSR